MIRLKVRDPAGDLADTFLIEDRPDIGPEICQYQAAKSEAGRSVVVDGLARSHCDVCDTDIADQIGLTHHEVDAIRGWRERKERGISSGELGRILDKICDALETSFDCDSGDIRIVLEVEPVP